MRVGVHLGPVSVSGRVGGRARTEGDTAAGVIGFAVFAVIAAVVLYVIPWFQGNWYWIRWVLMALASLVLGFIGWLIVATAFNIRAKVICGCWKDPEKHGPTEKPQEPVERAIDRVDGSRLLVPGPAQYKKSA